MYMLYCIVSFCFNCIIVYMHCMYGMCECVCMTYILYCVACVVCMACDYVYICMCCVYVSMCICMYVHVVLHFIVLYHFVLIALLYMCIVCMACVHVYVCTYCTVLHVLYVWHVTMYNVSMCYVCVWSI